MAQVFNEQFSGSSLDTTKWDSSAPAKVAVSGGSAVLTTNALNDQTTIYTKQINSSTGLYQQATIDGSYTLMEAKVTPQGQKSGAQAYDLSFIATKYTVAKGLRAIGFQLFANTGTGASTLYRIRPYSVNQGVYNIGNDTATFTVNNPIWLRAKVTSRGAGILEYSLNGSSWTVIEIERDGFFYNTSDVYPQVVHNTFAAGASATALVDYVTLDVEEPVAIPSTAPSTGVTGGFGTFGFGGVYAGEVNSGGVVNIDLTTQTTTHSTTSDNVALTQSHSLTGANTSHSHTATSPVLTQLHNITVANASHTLASDNISIAQIFNLATNSASHSLASDNLALTTGLAVLPNPTAHAVTSDNLTLSQVHGIVLESTSHDVTSPNVVLTEHKSLVVPNSSIAHTATSVTLNELYTLSLNNTNHSVISTEPQMVQHAVLPASNSSISLTSDELPEFVQFTLLNQPSNSVINLPTDSAQIEHQYLLLTDSGNIAHYVKPPMVTELDISEYEIGILRPSGTGYGQIESGGTIESGLYTPESVQEDTFKVADIDNKGIYR